MSNNDKFIRDTTFGKLMESSDDESCLKCKYLINNKCTLKKDGFECLDEHDSYYFAKDEVCSEAEYKQKMERVLQKPPEPTLSMFVFNPYHAWPGHEYFKTSVSKPCNPCSIIKPASKEGNDQTS